MEFEPPIPGVVLESPGIAMVVFANTIQFSRGMRVAYPRVQSRMTLVCHEGSGYVTVNGIRRRFGSGDFCLLPWNHSIRYHADRLDPFLLSGVHVIPDYDARAAVAFGVAHGPGQPFYNDAARRDAPLGPLSGVITGRLDRSTGFLERIVRLAVDLFGSGTFDPVASNALARLLIRELLQWITGDAAPDGAGEPEPGIGALESYLLERLHEPITLARMSAVYGSSVSTLRRRFREALGVSPYEWVLRHRLRAAEGLLRGTALPVRRIAERVGVSDPAYFSRLFRSRVGMTPLEYRRERLRL